jgi:hypothetical protein
VALLCGAAFLLCGAIWSLATGNTVLFHSTVKRSEEPIQYWAGVLVIIASCIAFIVIVLLDWHHRMTGQ